MQPTRQIQLMNIQQQKATTKSMHTRVKESQGIIKDISFQKFKAQ